MTSDLDTPEVSETSVVLRFSHSLEVLSVDGIKTVGNKVVPSSGLGAFLSVHEPLGNVVLARSGKNVVDSGDLLLSDFT